MKAIVFESPKKVNIKELPDPIIKDDEVLIAVKSAGVCGTDVHIFDGDFIGTYPVIPGHEFSGDIVEIGTVNNPYFRENGLKVYLCKNPVKNIGEVYKTSIGNERKRFTREN